MTEALNKRPVSDGLAITADELKAFYLFGIDLTDDDGNEMPKQLLEHYIRSAQDWVEKELNGVVVLCEKEIVDESHDYHRADYQSYSGIKLFRSPVQSVSKVAIQLPLSTSETVFDPSWYRVDQQGAFANLLPTVGTFSSILISQGGSFLPLLYSGLDYVPHMMKVTYTAGFKKGQLPPVLKDVIGMRAALGPLNIAGDLIAGAGIANKSISLDGLSQSIGTTASATNAGYGARIIQYQKQIKDSMANLKEYYAGINMVVG